MEDEKLNQIALKWNIPLDLLNKLIEASRQLNEQDRAVGSVSVIEDIIYQFLNNKNDN